MTKKERRDSKLLNGSRKRRIATGSGTSVEEVNRLVKQFMEMSRVMKQMGMLGQKGVMRTGIANLFRR
jgi:signal recognition particle subunit SRP54